MRHQQILYKSYRNLGISYQIVDFCQSSQLKQVKMKFFIFALLFAAIVAVAVNAAPEPKPLLGIGSTKKSVADGGLLGGKLR